MKIARPLLALSAAGLCAYAGSACVGDSSPVGSDAGVDAPSATDAGVDATDGGASDSSSSDAAQDAPIDAGPRCDPTKPFGTPVNEGAGVNTAQDEDGARLSPSELELFLTRADSIGKRINRYTRTDLVSAWSTPTIETGLVVTPPTQPASMSLALDPTALTAYLAVFTGSLWQIYLSGRSSIGGAWSTPTAVANISSNGFTDEQPWINPAGNRLYFMSNRPAGTYKIFVAAKSGTFSTPTILDTSDNGESRWPVLSADELTLYYGSYDGTNGVRIYKKTRTTIGGAWSTGVADATLNGSGLNASSITAPTSLTTDTCEIYFISNRAGGQGGIDVWHAIKSK